MADQEIVTFFANHGVGVRTVEAMTEAELEAFAALVGQPYNETRHVFAGLFHEYQESRKAVIDGEDE